MKQALDVQANNRNSSAIIEFYYVPVKVNGREVFSNEAEGICKHKGSVRNITIYTKKNLDSQKSTVIYLTRESVKALYNAITEIESTEVEDYLD
jgi:hypothetical protein